MVTVTGSCDAERHFPSAERNPMEVQTMSRHESGTSYRGSVAENYERYFVPTIAAPLAKRQTPGVGGPRKFMRSRAESWNQSTDSADMHRRASDHKRPFPNTETVE